MITGDDGLASTQTSVWRLGHLFKEKQEACGLPLWPLWLPGTAGLSHLEFKKEKKRKSQPVAEASN